MGLTLSLPRGIRVAGACRVPMSDCHLRVKACCTWLICFAIVRTLARIFWVMKALPRRRLKWIPMKSKTCMGSSLDLVKLMRKPRL